MDYIILNQFRTSIESKFGYSGEQIKCLMARRNEGLKSHWALFSAHEDADTGMMFECIKPDGGDVTIKPYYSPSKVMSMYARSIKK